MIEAVTDYAIFQLDANGLVSSWNPGAEKIKGYKAEEIIGRHFSCFYTAEDQKAGTPDKVLDTAKREGRYEAEAWRVRKDGSRLFASVVVDPIRDEEGEVLALRKSLATSPKNTKCKMHSRRRKSSSPLHKRWRQSVS